MKRREEERKKRLHKMAEQVRGQPRFPLICRISCTSPQRPARNVVGQATGVSGGGRQAGPGGQLVVVLVGCQAGCSLGPETS